MLLFMADILEKKIRSMNREILNLKTSHPVASNMITFYGSFNWSPDQTQGYSNHIYEITYVAGNQPIMTWIAYSDSNIGWVKFGEPNGNKQYMYDTGSWHEEGEKFGLLSTRQILGIRKIS